MLKTVTKSTPLAAIALSASAAACGALKHNTETQPDSSSHCCCMGSSCNDASASAVETPKPKLRRHTKKKDAHAKKNEQKHADLNDDDEDITDAKTAPNVADTTREAAFFEEYADRAKRLKGLCNQDRLSMYGLFKAATVGKVSTKCPSAFSAKENAKWKAWKKVEHLCAEDAKLEYVRFVKSLLKK